MAVAIAIGLLSAKMALDDIVAAAVTQLVLCDQLADWVVMIEHSLEH